MQAASAQPEALSAFARVGQVCDLDLSRAGRRLAQLHPALGADVAAHAASWSSLDRWVGAVGKAFESADAGSFATSAVVRVGWSATNDPWVTEAFPSLAERRVSNPGARANPDELARFVRLLRDDEVWVLARSVARVLDPNLRQLSATNRAYLLAALWPIRDRLDARWPRATLSDPAKCKPPPPQPSWLSDVRRVLDLQPKRREADFGTGFVDGVFLGDIDDEGFTNSWGEFGRIAGQFAGGLVPVVADARDAGANLARGRWAAAGANAFFAIPGFGDAGRLLKDGDRSLELLGRLDDLKDADEAARLFRQATEGAEAWKLIDGPLWTAGRFPSSEANLFDHFASHAHQFDGVLTPLDYAEASHAFVHNPPRGAVRHLRSSGEVVVYYEPTNTYAVMQADGAPKTMFKPKRGKEYFDDDVRRRP